MYQMPIYFRLKKSENFPKKKNCKKKFKKNKKIKNTGYIYIYIYIYRQQ